MFADDLIYVAYKYRLPNYKRQVIYYQSMPQHKSAIKRVRQISKRREHNRQLRSTMRTLYKKAMGATNKEEAEKYVRDATSYIDRMVKVGIIHKNNAANKKSNLDRYLNTL